MARQQTVIYLNTGAEVVFDGIIESASQNTVSGDFTALKWTNAGKDKLNLWGVKLEHVVAVVSTSMPEGG